MKFIGRLLFVAALMITLAACGGKLETSNDEVVISLEQKAKYAHSTELELVESCLNKYYDDEDYKKAIVLCRIAAERGNILAQLFLGVAYYESKDVKQDYKKVIKWWLKAREQGFVEVENSIDAILESKGVIKQQDYRKWVKQFRKVWMEQMPLFFGLAYYEGKGVERDYKEAIKWFHKAAEQELALAQYNLGSMHYKGKGVERDYKEAVKWFRRAAEQELALAQYDLGTMYYKGKGVERDYKEAVRWFRRASEQGLAIAQYNLGVMYYKGKGVIQNYKEAYIWYSLAVVSDKVAFNETVVDVDKSAIKNRNIVAEKLSPSGLEEAQEEAERRRVKIERIMDKKRDSVEQ